MLEHKPKAVADQYFRLLTEPHLRTNPVVGAPSLCWHIAVWPLPADDPHNVRVQFKNDEEAQQAGQRAAQQYNELRNEFIKNCNVFLETLQKVARSAPLESECFDLKEAAPNSKDLDPQLIRDRSVGFTLWWHPAGLQKAPPIQVATGVDRRQRIPPANALCVRVKADLHSGFATFAFYIDLKKSFNFGSKQEPPAPAPFPLRDKILSAEERIASYFDERINQLKNGQEDTLPDNDRDEFKRLAHLIHGEVWSEFEKHFVEAFALRPGVLFASFRGHAIETRGKPSSTELQIQGTEYRPRFKFDKKTHEANIVLKGYWPFILLTKENSEAREYVACQVNGRRAIYVSSLGAPEEHDAGDDTPALTNTELSQNDEHIIYTLLIKERHHKQQLGRLYDRINALGTFRMYALKDHGEIRLASTNIRLRGQELDAITGDWHEKRLESDQSDEAQLGHCRKVEIKLISLMDQLNHVGEKAVGGLTFRISRSRYYIETFKTRLTDLRVERIEGWVPYDEFARRRLYSMFDFVEKTGARLRALRQRLRDTMDAVQTSAILLQTSVQANHQNETKKNTAAVANSQDSTDNLARVGVFVAAATLATQTGMESTQFFATLKAEVARLAGFGLDKIDPKNLEYFLLISISIAVAALIWMLIKWIKLLIAERKKLNTRGMTIVVMGAAAATLAFFWIYGTMLDFYAKILADIWPPVVDAFPVPILKSINAQSAAHGISLMSMLALPVIYLKIVAFIPWFRRQN